MDIGFTGSRYSLLSPQTKSLTEVILGIIYETERITKLIDAGSLGTVGAKLLRERSDMRTEGIGFHHGCCTGADETAHNIVKVIPGIIIHGHPGTDDKGNSPYLIQVSALDFDILYPRKPYRTRNLDIVSVSDILIACPAYPEDNHKSGRSGTWQTVRMARQSDIPIVYVWRNGEVTR